MSATRRFVHELRNILKAVKMWHDEHKIPVHISCKVLKVTRSAYYKWLKANRTLRISTNEKIAELMKHIHEQHPDMEYRRIRDKLYRDYGMEINDKRVLRICHKLGIKSTIKYSRHSCTVDEYDLKYVTSGTLHR